MKYFIWLSAACLMVAAATLSAAERPNILLILADDLGYGDLGFQGCQDIPTPNLDALARRSVRCSSGYVTHPFCSPTRAGLLTGRYQQRFGHENNPVWLPDDATAGLPLTQITLPQVLQSAGYTTACIGKWHLGAHPSLHPNRRGFDHYFGFLGGGHNYLPTAATGGVEYKVSLDRNGVAEPLKEYLTTTLGNEAAAYIKRQKDKPSGGAPWFLYVAFNAPHTPLQSTQELLARAKHIGDETRRGYAALLMGLDDAIGTTLTALRESGQENNTLVFFLSDNGGPTEVTHSENRPLRGAKGTTYEGGVRVPFLVSWSAKLPNGSDYAQPVSSLDIFATSVAVAEAKAPTQAKLDGVNLLPYLSAQNPASPHDKLYWRAGGGVRWAVREGDWKLVKMETTPPELFNLASDIGETTNLASKEPDVVSRLKAAYETWNAQNVAPVFAGPDRSKAKAKKGK